MIIEATLIGILCYLGALSSPRLLGLTGGWYLITRPLISGMLVGIILGDIKTGIMIGVAVQAVYIAMVTPGGSMPADLNFVAYPAIALGSFPKRTRGRGRAGGHHRYRRNHFV